MVNNYKHITIFDDSKRKIKISDSTSNLNSSSNDNKFFIERNDYLLPKSQVEKYNIDSYVNTNPNRTMFKLHAVPIDIESENNENFSYNSYSSNVNKQNMNRAQSTSSLFQNSSNNKKTERPKSPTMLVDLVINTPKSDIKIQRKCKSYEVSFT